VVCSYVATIAGFHCLIFHHHSSHTVHHGSECELAPGALYGIGAMQGLHGLRLHGCRGLTPTALAASLITVTHGRAAQAAAARGLRRRKQSFPKVLTLEVSVSQHKDGLTELEVKLVQDELCLAAEQHPELSCVQLLLGPHCGVQGRQAHKG
jgi:hypothetical protein